MSSMNAGTEIKALYVGLRVVIGIRRPEEAFSRIMVMSPDGTQFTVINEATGRVNVVDAAEILIDDPDTLVKRLEAFSKIKGLTIDMMASMVEQQA